MSRFFARIPSAPRLPSPFLVAILIGPGLTGAGLTGACQSVALTESGFLSDYSKLEVVESERARSATPTERLDRGGYSGLYAEPLTIRLQPSSEDAVSAQEARLLRENYRLFLAQAVGGSLPIVDAPGPGKLTLRAALTEVDTINPYLNWFTAIVVLWPFDLGGATIELELVDGETGQQVAALVNADRGTYWNGIQAMKGIGHACQAVEESVAWVADFVGPDSGR